MSASVELYERKLQKDAEQFLNLSLDLDERQGELDELQEKNEILDEDLREYRALYFDKAKEYDALFQAYQATVTSSAWKMTKPLRASLDLAKRILKSNRIKHA